MKRLLILSFALAALAHAGCSGNRLFSRTANSESCSDGCDSCDSCGGGGYMSSPSLSAPLLSPGGFMGQGSGAEMGPGPY